MRLRRKLQFDERKAANQRRVLICLFCLMLTFLYTVSSFCWLIIYTKPLLCLPLEFCMPFLDVENVIKVGWILIGYLSVVCSDTHRFWDSKVAESCCWQNVAYLSRADYLPEDFSSYYTLVPTEVQTMDCSMIQFFLQFLDSWSWQYFACSSI